MSISTNLTSMFNDAKIMNDPTVECNVELSPSRLMDRLAQEILAEITRIMPYAGYAEVSNLEVEDISKYLHTLLWMRCDYVSSRVRFGTEKASKAFTPYRSLYKYLAVPVVFSQMLLSIGQAYDNDFALKFIPTCTITEDRLLSVEELNAISDLFRRMERNGLKLVYGLPKDVDGELDFMALCCVEGVVKGYRKSHPVYGFLAAFFEQKKFNEITGLMCRVFYGYTSDYEMHVSRLFQAMSTTNVPHVN